MIEYFRELRENWRPLFAATFGLGTGSAAITLYTSSIIAPRMIGELGWSKAQFALLGALSLVNAFAFPIAGRLADLFGTRRTVLIGMITLPLAFVAYSLMTGPIWQYITIYVVAGVLCITTTNTVYSRMAVQYVDKARGLALAIVASGPAVTGVVISLIINNLIESRGWRTTYQALAVYAVITAIITLILLPREKNRAAARPVPSRRAREDYPLIFRTPAFWILLIAMLACNLPQIVAMFQLKMVLLEKGIPAKDTSLMLAALPAGVLVGRFATGFALDRYPTHIVGFFGLGMPSIGLFMMATGVSAPLAMILAVICIGFAVGAEGDILAYVVARKFGVAIYSSVMGLMTMAISISVALGSGLLSLTLKLTGTFNAFLLICAVAVFAGSLLMLLLADGRAPAGRIQPA